MSVLIAAASRSAAIARLGLLLAAVVCSAVSAPAAAARSHRSGGAAPASGVVLRSPFRPIGVASVSFVTSGDYVLLSNAYLSGQDGDWTVINDRLDTTTGLDPQCGVTGLDPPWALLSCASPSDPSGAYDVELYSLTDRTEQTVTPSPGLPPQCTGQSDLESECARADRVGAYWIKWDTSCYHCAVTSYFQNIQTGELRGDPTNATTVADLNSPTLADQTCPGVRLSFHPHSPTPWDSLSYDGQFALVSDYANVFLERCGTHMRRLLVNGSSVLASNTGAIVWQTVTSRLTGLLLPSLQRFTIPLPSAIVRPPGSTGDTPVLGLGLTSNGLYVRDEWNGTVWRTASPAALPLNTSRPKVTRSGKTLSCRRGRWHNATRFSYAWLVNGTARKTATPTLDLRVARRRHGVTCKVIASNAAGMTTASARSLTVP